MKHRVRCASNYKQLLPALLLTLFLCCENALSADAQLTVHNRSNYTMVFAFWKDGTDCSRKQDLGPDFNINAAQPQTLSVPAEKLVAVGVAVFEMQDKLPLACDYILSFKLKPGSRYSLEYDVHDRRCYGQIYESNNDAYQLILPGEKEGLTERIPVFGWDKLEPGCEEQ